MANTARLSMRWLQGTGTAPEAEVVATFHVRRADGAAPYLLTDLRLLQEQLVNWWELGDLVGSPPELSGGPYLDYGDATRLVETTGQVIQPVEGLVDVVALSPPLAGNSGDGPGPPQAAIGLSWLTALDSRRGRGRTYLPAPRSGCYGPDGALVSLLSQGAAEPAARVVARWGRVLWRNIADSLGTTPQDRLCVFSRVDGVARTITSVRAQDYLQTQRRRAITATAYEELFFGA